VLPLLLLVGCGSPAPTTAPTGTPTSSDVADLARRIEQRRAELKTAKFHTDGFASDGDATEVKTLADGVLRQDADGLVGTLAMQVQLAGGSRKMDMVLLKDKSYVHVEGAPMPEGKKWGLYTPDNAGEVQTLLRGFGPGSTIGAELDYVRPEAALILRKESEQLDGTAVTRYDLAVDPTKMAKLIDDPDIQLQHSQLAEYGVRITSVVWVDSTGLALKAEYRFELGGKVVKRSTTRFTDWGAPIEVVAPPEAEVVPADQLPK
jgi:hypothetical protein